ncbi:peptidase inhibitor family I36 protein [Streptomyces fulvoviolaceus]|uniref:peptidase inhibitor family I36 protein n=1 Tax=Streptomyces fulvoviolaceus TaxID=285535 RepID=UPI0021BF2C87|nr:peptidase inhibitor family I36 protein [Streptomyces fulvoviolaceus]MCT9074989.1 peptidase inhibitor family I36 protein [Streptomyces fulvoviolaceus]
MNGSRTVRRVSALAVSVVAVGGLALSTAGPAAAVDQDDGILEAGEFGLYYNSGRGGCVFDLLAGDNDFANNDFKDRPTYVNCPGEGQTVNDNTASYWNRDTTTWYVYTDSYHEGTRGDLPAGYIGDATSTFKNEISSGYWYL